MFIGKYEIVSDLGDGGMGTVKLARAPSGELVVVKQAHPGDPLLRELLVDEARVGMRLKHPNIVETLDFFEENGEPVLVVAFVAGASLADIRAKGPLDPGVVCRIGRQIAEALDALHHATGEDGRPLAVLHRDVTPNNIMVGYDGNARLIDLGIAKSDDRRSQKTQTGFLRGTLRYMAPEVFEDSRYSPQSDLWALGISLLDAALGRQALKGSEGEVVGKVMTGRVMELRPGEALDKDLEKALKKLLEKDPRKRPARGQDAAALFTWIEKKLGGDAAKTERALKDAVGEPPRLDAPTDDDEATVRLMTQAQSVYTIVGAHRSEPEQDADPSSEQETLPPDKDVLEEPPFAPGVDETYSHGGLRDVARSASLAALPAVPKVPSGAGPREALSSYAAQLRALEGNTPPHGTVSDEDFALPPTVADERAPVSLTSTTTATPSPPSPSDLLPMLEPIPRGPIDDDGERRPLPFAVLGIGFGLLIGLIAVIVIGMRPNYVDPDHKEARRRMEEQATAEQAVPPAAIARDDDEGFAVLDGRAGDRPKCFVEGKTRAFSFKDASGALVTVQRLSDVPEGKREFVLCRE